MSSNSEDAPRRLREERCERPAESLDHVLGGDLWSLHKAFNAGVELAVFDVLQICEKYNVQCPLWALKGLERLSEPRRLKKAVTRYRRDLIHFYRFDAVNEVREYRSTRWKDYQDELKAPGLSEEARRKLEQLAPHDPGKSEDVFREAAETLVGTPAYGSPETIRSSFKLVRKSNENPANHGRFMMLSLATRRKHGLP